MKSLIEPQDIAALSRWDQVQFAVKCAHRTLPLFAEHRVRSAHHLPALEVAVQMARARADLGDGTPKDYEPGLPIQLHDSYEMKALHTTLRAIKDASLNLQADGSAPWTMWQDAFDLEVTIYAAIATSCLAAFDAAFGKEQDCAQHAALAYEAVTVPGLPDGELLAGELGYDYWFLSGCRDPEEAAVAV